MSAEQQLNVFFYEVCHINAWYVLNIQLRPVSHVFVISSVFILYLFILLSFQLLEKAAKNFAFQETVIENSTTVSNSEFF